MPILKLYTDGACANNQSDTNFGGYGTVLEYGSHRKELFGSKANTTNNIMELTAVIEGLKHLTRENLTIHVYTDSAYVADCFRNNWHVKWKKNNWMRTKTEEVLNKELWIELLDLVQSHNVTFFRVKGHVSLSASEKTLATLFSKFKEWNGSNYTYEDFEHVISMNNLADELANKGIAECKSKLLDE